MKNLFDTDFYKFIITQTSSMEKIMSLAFNINVILFSGIIYWLAKQNMPLWAFIPFLFFGFISSTSYTKWIIFDIKAYLRLKRMKGVNHPTIWQIEEYYNSLKPAFEKFEKNEHHLLCCLAISKNNRDYFNGDHWLEAVQNINNEFNKIKELKIIHTKPALVIETDRLLKEVIRRYYKQNYYTILKKYKGTRLYLRQLRNDIYI